MKRNGRLIAAGLLFVALLAWTLVKERGRAPAAGEAFGIDPSTVTALDVKTPERHLVLQKTGDQWMLEEPVKGYADKDAVGRMVNAVAELKPSGSRSKLQVTDKQFGLDKPCLTATITYGGGKQATVALGGEVTGGSEYFAKLDNRTELYFVPASVQSDLNQNVDSLRDKQVVHLNSEDVQSVVLQYPDHVVAIEKRGTGPNAKWFLTQPYEAKADEWAAKTVVDKIAQLKADAFAPEQPPAGKNYGFSKPQIKATVKTQNGKQYVLDFGARTRQVIPDVTYPGSSSPTGGTAKDLLYVRLEGRPETLLVPGDQTEDLKKTAMELRDKRILALKKDNIDQLRVERKQGLNFTVKRLPNGWQLVDPSPGDAQTQKVDDLLFDLTQLEATDFLGVQKNLQQYGLAIPETVFTINAQGSQPIKVLIGYAKGDNSHYAMTSTSKQVYVISDTLLLDLPKTLKDIKETTPPAPPPSTTTSSTSTPPGS